MALTRCGKCGQIASDTQQFCPHCGHKVKSEAPADDTVIHTPPRSASPSSADNKKSVSTPPQRKPGPALPPAPQKKKFSWLWTVVIIGIFLIVALLVLILVRMQDTSRPTLASDHPAAELPSVEPVVIAAESSPVDVENNAVTEEPAPAPAPAPSKRENQAVFDNLVAEWNNSLNQRNRQAVYDLYDDYVFYYTKTLSLQEVVEHRDKLYNTEPGFGQRLISPVDVVVNSDGTVTTFFTKEAYSSKGNNVYPSYLVWRNDGYSWKIIKESDKVTDANVAKKRK